MLRNYQKNAIKAFETTEKKNVVLSMATGSGKTYTFCEIAKRFFIEKVERVLILVHREELLKQAVESLGERCFQIKQGVRHIPSDYYYYVGMVETVSRRLSHLPSFGLVIVDECHIGNFKKLPFFSDPKVRVLGVTATPLGTKPLSKEYDELIIPVTIKDLIDEGFLLNCDVYAFASDLVESAKFKVKRGEFDEKQMEDFYSSEKMVKNAIEAYWSNCAGKKTICFNVNIAHNMAVYEAFKSEGLNVFYIDGETEKKKRTEIISNFKKSTDGVICNVGVLTTGFDDPSINVVILNRATKSLTLYLQMVGRGARTFEGKEKFTVIDLGKNTVRHKFYDEYRDWQKYFKEGSIKESDGTGSSPVKECPSCGFLAHTRVVTCENCGHDYEEAREQQRKEEEQKQLYLLLREKPLVVPIESIFNMADERGWKEYSCLWKIAEHIAKYDVMYPNVEKGQYIRSISVTYLEAWCKRYGKKNNQWHKDFIWECIEKKKAEFSPLR
jgi:superfamily II DNA or RNA helicase